MKVKKLYLLERTDDVDYDEFDSAVICAFSLGDAIAVQKIGSADHISGRCIGVARATVKCGMVLGSFNTG